MSKAAAAEATGRSASTPSEWQQLRGRRRRGRPHPPRRPGRLGGDAGAADLVARRPRAPASSPTTRPQWYVRGGARRGRADRRAAARPRTVDWARRPARRGRRADQLGQPDALQRPRAAATSTAARSTRGSSACSARSPRRTSSRSPSLRSDHSEYDGRAATSPTTTTAGRWTSPRSTASPAPTPTANAGPCAGSRSTPAPTHTYAVIAGLRWRHALGRLLRRATGPRWHAEPPYPRWLRRPAPDRVLTSSDAARGTRQAERPDRRLA